MALAGRTADAGRIPGQRIATETYTSDSTTFTDSQTEIMSVTASLVSGRTYRVRAFANFESDTGGVNVAVRINKDTAGGETMQTAQTYIDNTSSLGFTVPIEVEHTASATGDKTFVVTALRNGGGSGTLFMGASSLRPAYLYVDYIRG